MIVPPSGQLVRLKPLGVATTKPAGKASVKTMPLTDVPTSPPLAVKVNVKLVLLFCATLVAPKALLKANAGGVASVKGTMAVVLGVCAVTPPFVPVALALF